MYALLIPERRPIGIDSCTSKGINAKQVPGTLPVRTISSLCQRGISTKREKQTVRIRTANQIRFIQAKYLSFYKESECAIQHCLSKRGREIEESLWLRSKGGKIASITSNN